MTIIINGILGRMGQATNQLLCENGINAAGIDINASEGSGILRSLSEYSGEADCVIDFSFHTSAFAVSEYCRERKLPLVEATTGHTEEEARCFTKLADDVPVLKTGNLSYGIALLTRLVKIAARSIPNADIEIVETHHNRKADAPSGTAMMLAEAVRSERPELHDHLGRSGIGVREKDEIGIQSVRIGSVVGRHEVIFGWQGQLLTLKHEALDRSLFAQGAVEAAKFLIGRDAGLYTMDDVIDSQLC